MDRFEDFPPQQRQAIERTTQEVGRYLFAHLEHRQPNVLERRWWDDRILAWAMQDESVKVQMFRFIDVLPMLTESAHVTRHLHEYFHDVQRHLPAAVRLGLAVATPHSAMGRALAIAARRNALGHARRFIVGSTPEEVLGAILRARKLRMAFTLDRLGEAVLTEAEADLYLAGCLTMLEQVAPQVNRWPEEPQIDCGAFRELPRMNLSIKMSALDSQFDPIDPAGCLARVGPRLRTLLRAAQRVRAHLHVDMESYRTKDLTLWVFRQVLSEPEFAAMENVGVVIQCYLRDAKQDLLELRDWARQRGAPVWVRLVKGAYWDYETVHAAAEGWPVPVFQQKSHSDINFERCCRFLMRNHAHLRAALASHNLRSLAHGIAVGRHLGLPTTAYELQMLYGMADAEKQVLVNMGHRLRIYMPYGELIPGMAYLVRRLLENTSNDSFLRASFTENVSPEVLLMNPEEVPMHSTAAPAAAGEPLKPGSIAPTTTDAALAAATSRFRNEPLADFSRQEERHAMSDALKEVRSQFGVHRLLVIGDCELDTDRRLQSYCPSHARTLVGTTALAERWHVQEAVQQARAVAADWAGREVEERAELLRRTAAEIRAHRRTIAAWIVHEAGKGWREADGDVCEAIDFCEYYAAAAIRLQSRRMDVPGEENRLIYRPRGVAAVISPWNFPLAILTGMTTAALVTGNPVIMKPAEQTPLVGALLMDAFRAAGFPPGVVQYMPGYGETVGAALVEHEDVDLIAFTGSRQVGLAINARAAEVARGARRSVKRVIAEMGGKNAIIVDDDADLDEAVQGVLKSAFGYQGQKCSACSRCIVLAGIYEPFIQRLVAAAHSLKIGPAEDAGSQLGPVIDAESLERIGQYIELGRKEGRCVLATEVGPWRAEGHYVGPHIFADVSADARIAQEEIFGPVLAVLKARDLDEALEIANATDYALTGGLYSRSPANLDRVSAEFEVGNLYINRPITGALVGRQPFGGFRLSGIGSQAGGPDYLLQFVIPRVISENTLRRGFAPPVDSA